MIIESFKKQIIKIGDIFSLMIKDIRQRIKFYL